MTKNCKSCRRDLSESLFVETYKTCTECRTKRKGRLVITIKNCQDFAEAKDGACLSTEYKNNKTKMRWQCSEGHKWESIFSNIKSGTWCKKCVTESQKLNIEECQTFAETKGGACLSTEYKNSKTKMKWKCSEGHEWESNADSIKQGKWCPKCAIKTNSDRQRFTIQECQTFAEAKGGSCLSTEYKNNKTKMRWKCSEGHEWESTFDSIKQGTWCPNCAGNVKLTIEECQTFAEAKGGTCLSTEYTNSKTKMRWKCSEGHEWHTAFNDIKHGSWCPECVGSKSEQLCRDIFENNLLEKFPNTRPKWLEGLELDGYNEKLNMAFEYNGKQHYDYIPFFHNNDPDNFELQKARDRKKYKLCREHGLKLIIIPYQFDFRQPQELEDFILNEL